MTNNEKREAAYELYVSGMTAVEIARILKVSTNTLSTWTTDGDWRSKKAEAAKSKKARMDMLGDLIDYQLEVMHQRMKFGRERAIVLAEQQRVINAARGLFMLYIAPDEIADVLSVEEEAVDKWAKEGFWAEKRIAQGDEGHLQPLDKGEVDALTKMFSQVKGKEVTWHMVVDIVRELLQYVDERDKSLAKAIIPFSDDYLLGKRDALTAQ